MLAPQVVAHMSLSPETICSLLQTVQNYYAEVDQFHRSDTVELRKEKAEKLGRFFADDAVYTRGGEIYKGREAIIDFFCNKRKMYGQHTTSLIRSIGSVDMTVKSSQAVAVFGVFEGEDANCQPLQITFSDLWEFNSAGQVVKRISYFAQGIVDGLSSHPSP